MSLRFSTEQKAAARALLDHQCPTQTLVAACMGVTQRSMTDWIAMHRWTFVDFRQSGAQEAQARHRRNMLKSYGRNVPAKLRRLDYLEEARAEEDAEEEAEAARAEEMAASPIRGEAGALVRQLRDGVRRLNEQLMQRFASRDRTLRLETVEAAEALVPLCDALDRALRESGRQEEARIEAARHDAWAESVAEDLAADRALEMLSAPEFLRDYLEGLAESEDLEPEVRERIGRELRLMIDAAGS